MKLHFPHLLNFFVGTALTFNSFGQVQGGEDQYQQALKLNKSGQYQQSAKILRSLMTQRPEIERYKSDYIAVASNAKQCNEVLLFANNLYITTAPIYVQDSIFSCAVTKQSFEQIEALAKTILVKQGKNSAIESKLVTLALQGKNEKAALDWSKRYYQDYPNDINAGLLRAQVLQDFNQRYSALLIYEDLYAKHPKNKDVQQKIIEVLLDMGIPHLALNRIQKHQFSHDQTQKLRAMANSGAVDIRWSDADPSIVPNRFISVDKAISELQKAQDFAVKTKGSSTILNQIQNDLITAYEKRKEWKKSVALYEGLMDRNVDIPDYALLSTAISYDALHQYGIAEKILSKLYQKNSTDPEVAYEYYLNLADQDHYPEAKRVLDKLTSEFKQRPKSLEPSALDYTQLLINQAYLESYQDRHEAAFEKLEPIFSQAPANTGLLIAAGTISEWQGNPKASEEYFQIALNQDPKNIEAKVGVANAQMSQGNIKPFVAVVNELKNNYGDMISVQKAAERLEHFKEPYVTGNFVLGNGDYGVQKNNNWTADVKAYTSPINDNYRGFARYRGLNSGPAIPVNVQGFGGGVQYTGKDRDAEIEAGDLGYARVEVNQNLDDHWGVSASYEKNAFYLLPGSLYATYAGNVSGLNLKWKNNDTTESFVGYRYWVLTNNFKQEMFGSVTQRVLTEYNYKLDLSGWVGNQQNTNPNVGYFAPIGQTEYSGTVSLRILQWRDLATKKYDFWHRIFGSYGMVTQQGYATLPMNRYGYGQDFNVGDKRTLSWGLGRTSYPFDGAKSGYLTGYLNFEVRF